jgi:hypothetical protein
LPISPVASRVSGVGRLGVDPGRGHLGVAEDALDHVHIDVLLP